MTDLGKLKHRAFEIAWVIWHMRLRRAFDVINPNPERASSTLWMRGRPWWHLCCNGDGGGWRTKLCDWLERGFRFSAYQKRLDAEVEAAMIAMDGERVAHLLAGRDKIILLGK